jgi:hypothetical protein
MQSEDAVFSVSKTSFWTIKTQGRGLLLKAQDLRNLLILLNFAEEHPSLQFDAQVRTVNSGFITIRTWDEGQTFVRLAELNESGEFLGSVTLFRSRLAELVTAVTRELQNQKDGHAA